MTLTVTVTASLLDDLVASVQRVFDEHEDNTKTNSNSSSSTNSSSSSQVYLLRASDETVNVTLLARKGRSIDLLII